VTFATALLECVEGCSLSALPRSQVEVACEACFVLVTHGLGQPDAVLLHGRESTPLLLSAWLRRKCGLGLAPAHMKALPSGITDAVECDVRRGLQRGEERLEGCRVTQ
jgi:hypothetical protein